MDSGVDNSMLNDSSIKDTVSETSGVGDDASLSLGEVLDLTPVNETIQSPPLQENDIQTPLHKIIIQETDTQKPALGLIKEDLLRLEEMEKNIEECEMFLDIERRKSDILANPIVIQDENENIESKITIQVNDNEHIDQRNKENVIRNGVEDKVDMEESKNFKRSLPDELEKENLQLKFNTKNTFYHCEMCSPTSENKAFVENAEKNLGIMNTKLSSQEISDTSKKKLIDDENKTPPCSPYKKWNCLEKSDHTFPDTKVNPWDCGYQSSNYFIDASSLLDESEIASQPMSLVSVDDVFQESEDGKELLTNVFEKDEKIPSALINKNDNTQDLNFNKEKKENHKEQIELFIIEDEITPTVEKNINVCLEVTNETKMADTVEISETRLENEKAQPTQKEDKIGFKLGDMTNIDNSLLIVEEDPVPSLQIQNAAETVIDKPQNFNLFNGLESNIDCEEIETDLAVKERQQGSLIFQHSIPCYSLHEVRLRGGDDLLSDADTDNEQVVPSSDPVHDEDIVPVVQLSNPDWFQLRMNQSEPTSLVDQVPHSRKKSLESLPIVSGGVSPKDYSTSTSATSSPMSRRKHESTPIVSGGIKYVEEKKRERKSSGSSGSAWVVDMRTSSDSVDTLDGKEEKKLVPEHKTVSELKRTPPVGFFVDFGAGKKETNFPVEKSASLGYFIDFSGEKPPKEEKRQEHVRSKAKKNIFSMFINVEDEQKTEPKPEPIKQESKLTEKENDKKSFFMFIESDSPVTKRKPFLIPKSRQTEEKSHKRTLSLSTIKKDVQGSSVSLSGVKPEEKKKSPISRLPVKTPEQPKINVWEEKKQESWLTTRDVQINYTKIDTFNSLDETLLKKDNTFIIDDCKSKPKYLKDSVTKSSADSSSPFKSPKTEERDSGVVGTEESDDSFVKLSDMDKEYRNPYISEGKRKSSSRMSRSVIVEAATTEVNEPMSKSAESKAFASNASVRQSLNRIFPNLILPLNSPSYESEISSIHTSLEQNGLETSTSETDVSSGRAGPVSRLGEDLLRMFLEEISPDVIVDVGGRRMKAHKCILSSRCQYFAAMLSGGWVESAGNVISLQGFSYNSVHFALCHIYSGENKIPDSLNLVELATLADMLCLEGLKEVISHTLREKYCHYFHSPCAACLVGVLECLPIAAAYGLDDLYRKSLRWITKNFVRVWPTKPFASLPKELIDKCYQHYVVHMSVDSILDIIMNIDKLRGLLPNVKWAESICKLVNKLNNAAIKFIADHYSSVLTSDSFLALGRDAEWSISCLEDSLLDATDRLPPEQACWSHARLHRIITLSTMEDCPPEMTWNQEFLELLQTIAGKVENNLIKQAPKAARSKAWRQMEPELRTRIQEAACLILPDDTPSRSTIVRRGLSESSSTSSVPRNSRSFDIRQMKLAITQQQVAQTKRNTMQKAPGSMMKEARTVYSSITRTQTAEKKPEPVKRNFTQENQKLKSNRLLDVKPRYLEPKSPSKTINDKTNAVAKPLARQISSSDSSRTCSPSMRRGTTKEPFCKRPPTRGTKQTPPGRSLGKLNKEEKMSTDSLATESSYGEKEKLKTNRPTKSIVSPRPVNRSPYMAKSTPAPNIRKSLLEHTTKKPPFKSAVAKDMKIPVATTRASPRIPKFKQNNNNTLNGNIEVKRPTIGSRSGTFLKDEPSVLKKPHVDDSN